MRRSKTSKEKAADNRSPTTEVRSSGSNPAESIQMKIVRIVDFDTNLLEVFKDYARDIKIILPKSDVVLIGSASVPMVGKANEIDIMAIVENMDESYDLLVKNGFSGGPKKKELSHLKDRRKGIEADIHLTKSGSEFAKKSLTLRDALRKDPKIRKRMIDLKWSLNGKPIEEYREGKKPLIKEILRKKY